MPRQYQILHADQCSVRKTRRAKAPAAFYAERPARIYRCLITLPSLVLMTNRRAFDVAGAVMDQLQREIPPHFLSRLGNVTPVAAGAFPPTRRHALQFAREDWCLWGTRRTIHPLAGQGVNLWDTERRCVTGCAG